MSKKTKLIIIIIVIVLLVSVILYNIVKNYRVQKEQDGSDVKDDPYKGNELEEQGVLFNLDSKGEYYFVKRVVEKYFLYSKYIQEYDEFPISQFSSMFDKKYLEKYNIDELNVKEIADKDGCTSIRIDKIYVTNFVSKPTEYIVWGSAINEKDKKIRSFTMMIKDNNTENYSILLDNYLEDYGLDNVNVGSKVPLIEEEVTNDCRFINTNESEDEYIEDIFEEFRKDCIYFPERAYNHLSSETKSEKFESLDDFVNYVNNNYSKIFSSTLENYVTETLEGVRRFSCTTTESELIVFDISSIIDYKVSF